MKNYLFAPFKDNDEKVETFNYFKNYLPKGHRHEFIMFIGRLESTYDAEICDLKEDNTKSRKYILHLEEEHDDLLKACKLLKADNKELKDKLQAVNDDYNNDHKVHNEYEDGLLKEIKELKAVNDEVRRCNKTMDGILLEREKEIKEKDKQYHMLASSKSNDGLYDEVKELQAELDKANNNNMRYSSLKEYKAEAEEYFHHNPKCKSLLFFMIGNDEFGVDGDWNGCYNGTLYSDDCIIEKDNEEVIA